MSFRSEVSQFFDDVLFHLSVGNQLNNDNSLLYRMRTPYLYFQNDISLPYKSSSTTVNAKQYNTFSNDVKNKQSDKPELPVYNSKNTQFKVNYRIE